MYSSRPRFRSALIWTSCVLVPALASAVPTAVNDTYTATEDTVLTVSNAGTTVLVTGDFEPGDNQGDGFTVVKNAFGTTADVASTTFMSGALVTTDKHSGTSSYYTECGRDATQFVPKSVAIQRTITLTTAATVRITYWYHMIVQGMEWGSNQYEISDHLFKVDSTFYGTPYTETLPTPDVSNTAVRHVLGPSGAVPGNSALNDSGWLQNTRDIPLGVGTHTILLGSYNNSTNSAQEWVRIWFDDVVIETVNSASGVLVNDTGGAASAIKLTDPTYGTLNFASTGTFTYTPVANYNGPDSFTYQASDGVNLSNVATVTINVTSVNDPPIAVANTYNLTEDVPLITTLANGVLANDTDADGTALTANVVATTTHGTLAMNANGTFTYTPVLNYNGPDSFTYRANDGSVNSNTVTVTLNITAVNDGPLGLPDSYTMARNTTFTLTTPNGSPVTQDVILGAVRDGTNTVTTPGSVWKYWDQGTLPAATVTTWHTAVNLDETGWLSGASELGYGDASDAPPWPEATVIGYGGNAALKNRTSYFRKVVNLVDVARITALDLQVMRDDGIILYCNGQRAYRNNLTAAPAYDEAAAGGSLEEHSWLSATSLGTGTNQNWETAAPTPAMFVEGNNLFAAEVHQQTDSSSDVSFDVKLTITRLAELGLLANDTDPEGQTFTAEINTQPANGVATVNADGTFSYTPTIGYSGTDTFTYRARDSGGVASLPITVTMTITAGSNAPPIVAADSYGATEEVTLTVPAVTGVLANDLDPDGDSFTANVFTQPTKGTLTLNLDGSFTYVPNLNATGIDTFTYRASDGKNSQPATVTITITNVNDAPIATNDNYGGEPGQTITVNAASGLLSNDTDVENNPLTAVLVTPPSSGNLTLNANGSFSYVPSATGVFTFTYKANDGLDSNVATVTISLDGAPVTLPETYLTNEDTPLSVPAATGVLNNDYDPEDVPLTAQLVAQGTKGTTTLNSNGSFNYTPNPNATGADVFTYRAFDGTRFSSVTSVTINITPVNDPPSATSNNYTVVQNAPFTSPVGQGVLANDTDPEGTPLTAVLVTDVLHGTLTLNANGSFTYTPAVNYLGEDSFFYKASDGALFSASVKVTLTIGNAADDIVITEIMCRPGTAYPENTNLEWIEIYNRSAGAVDLGGWTISSGVDYTFPANTVLGSHAYLVVAANATAFRAAFPAVTNYLGGWTGTLANNGEKITLTDPINVDHDSVSYATEGDWALRTYNATLGWDWDTKTNGGGYSIEALNPNLSNNNGQNWKPSAVVGGTPGAPNAALSINILPIISNVKHSPAVPTSADPVVISCNLLDETPFPGLQATLFWRNATTTTPPAFSTVTMSQDGQGKWFAPLPKQVNNTIIEFYISANDGTGVASRTWPAPTSAGQIANCQYQVSDEVPSPTSDTYRLILTATENAAYESLTASNPSSNKTFHQSMIVSTGTEASIRYLCTLRIRGNGSRSYQFKPMRISIPTDDPFEGRSSFNLNPKASHLQYLGMRCFQAAGLRCADPLPIELRRNGIEYTSSSTGSGSTPDFGRWVRMEDLGGEMVGDHWPEASTGNIYKKTRPDQYWPATLAAPSQPDGVMGGWSKQNNGGANDWSDMLGFFSVWQANSQIHFPGSTLNDVAMAGSSTTAGNGNWNNTVFSTTEMTNLETVADLDQWARWLAVMTILQSKETNLSNGEDDDYSIYFIPQTLNTVPRRRAQLVPHDMDTIFGLGDTPTAFNATNLYDCTETGNTFRTMLPLLGTSTAAGNADFRNRYYTALRELFGGVFNADTTASAYPPFYAFVDNHLSGWVPTTSIDTIKGFIRDRRNYLLGTGPGLLGAAAIPPVVGTATATFTAAHGALCIHEVLAQNVSVHNNGGTFPDVIELHNTGATSISLGGMTLTDDPLLKTKYTFPVGTSIAAGGYLVLYADPVTTVAPGTHLGFSLDQDGDAVFLYEPLANGQALVDSIVFGLQAPNLSIGRTGAGLTTWALCTPTPNVANTAVATLAAPGGLKINEWLGNAGTRFPDDFVEIYNPSGNPVALGGMRITDDFINYPNLGTLPPLSFMAGNSFVAFLAKGSQATPGNARELPFTMPSSTGNVALLGDNAALVDRVEIVAQFPDGSVGRITDGAANWSRLATASPGASNAALPTNTQNLLNYLRITELMYNPATVNQSEYLELRNVSDLAGSPVSLDLTGVYFANGITFTFPPTTLAAGAHLVLVGENAKFTTQFPATTIGGTFLGKLDNNGERVTLMLPNYGIAILDFTYNNTWHPSTDGLGSALAIIDPVGTLEKWDQRTGWEATPASPGSTPGFSVFAGPDTKTPANVPLYLNGSIIKGSLAANSITSGWSFVSGPSTPTFTTANFEDANATFTTPGIYVLQFSATAGATTLTDTLNVAVTETYASWAARTITGANAGQQAELQDADRDNIPNLIEWATGKNPLVTDHPITVISAGNVSGMFVLHYTRSKLIDPAVVLIPQFSEDLNIWYDASDPTLGTSWDAHKESEAGTIETWVATSYLNVEHYYFRLKVISP